MSENKKEILYTTNEEDQAEAARLQARLAQEVDLAGKSPRTTWVEMPAVRMDEGVHKYVLISAEEPAIRENKTKRTKKYFVTSKNGAAYHRDAAEPFVYDLENQGYVNIRVKGGGRINLDSKSKTVNIFGFSYGFGQADHSITKKVIDADEKFRDYNVTWSKEGY